MTFVWSQRLPREKSLGTDRCEARIRLQIEIEFGLEFDQSKERKPIWSLVNVALIGQIPI